MYKSLSDMVDDNSMMDLSQYFRLGKLQTESYFVTSTSICFESTQTRIILTQSVSVWSIMKMY